MIELINIGFGNLVAAGKIVSIVTPDSAPAKRLIQTSKEEKTLIDATQGRRTRAIIIMDDGHIILSAIQPDTIAGRLSNATES